MKKIVFVINYFYPDLASTGQLMTQLCSKLDSEFDITVIAAHPGYSNQLNDSQDLSDRYGNVKVIRVQLPNVNKNSKISRLRYIAIYFFKALYALLKEKKVSLIYTISQPPILGGMIGTLGKLLIKTKHVYNIQDFNPEQALAANYTNKSFVSKIALAIDKLNCKYSDHVVVVGEDMGDTLEQRFNYKNVPEYSVINNWTDEKQITPLDHQNETILKFKSKYNLLDKFIIMYSGNIGLYYDLENLIKITKEFSHFNDLCFLFVGDGAKKSEMQDYIKSNEIMNVLFLPYQPIDFIKYSLNVADVHLVVNQKGIKGVSVPSKIYGVMAAGKPIIGVLENGSEGHRLINESSCGYIAEPQDYESVKAIISRMYSLSKKEINVMGMNGRDYLEKNLKKDISIEKYRTLLNQLVFDKKGAQ